jgi:hypothetical protein
MDAAVDAADMKVLQWLLDRNAGRLLRFHSYRAAEEGNAVLLEWLLRNNCPHDLGALARAAEESGYETKELICKMVKDLRDDTLPPLAPYPKREAIVEK